LGADARRPVFTVLPSSQAISEDGGGANLCGFAMTYFVYILESESVAGRFYVGITDGLEERVRRHNRGFVRHTSKYVPWRLRTYVGFADTQRAFAFEKYLKSSSGRAFSKKRF
jgi:predicted GIY-YIG superfamily endonuclease